MHAICSTVGFRLDAGSRILPHPAKVSKGGEDAIFSEGRAFGVFDGVGGWKDKGVDPGLFSRELAAQVGAAFEGDPPPSAGRSLTAVLEVGLEATLAKKCVGSCTACLVRIARDGKLDALNLGDSGFRIFRDDGHGALELVAASNAQQHYFNCPYQLGTNNMNRARDADAYEARVQAGDVLMLATDGLLDNLFDDQIADILAETLAEAPAEDGTLGETLACRLADRARAVSISRHARTPWSEAREATRDKGRYESVDSRIFPWSEAARRSNWRGGAPRHLAIPHVPRLEPRRTVCAKLYA